MAAALGQLGLQIGQGLGGALGRGRAQAAEIRNIDSLMKFREAQRALFEKQALLAEQERLLADKYLGDGAGGGGFVGPSAPAQGGGLPGGIPLRQGPIDEALSRIGSQMGEAHGKQVAGIEALFSQLDELGRGEDALQTLFSEGIGSGQALYQQPPERLSTISRALTDLLRESRPDPLGIRDALGFVEAAPNALAPQQFAGQQRQALAVSVARTINALGMSRQEISQQLERMVSSSTPRAIALFGQGDISQLTNDDLSTLLTDLHAIRQRSRR